MASDGLGKTLRAMLASVQAGRPSSAPVTVRGFEPLPAPRSTIPDDVRAYVARATGAPAEAPPDAELAQAQDADARRRAFSSIGQGLDDAGRVIAGLGPGRRFDVDGDASVRALSQQRASGAAQAEAARKARLSDPTSPESAAFRARAAKILGGIYSPEELEGLTAADEANVLDIGKTRGTLKQRQAEAAARAAEAETNRAHQTQLARERNAQSGENARTMAGMARERLDLTKEAAERDAAKAARGPTLPASEIANYGGIDAATAMLDDLMKTREAKTGAFSGLTQYLPGTDAGEYADAQKVAAQKVGIILEKGKLAEGDLARYMAMTPTPGDSDERAKAKVENLKRQLALEKAAQFQALRDAGFNTGNLSPDVRPVQVGAPKGGNINLAESALVRVSNGQETLEIDPADLAAAEADGYKRLTP